MSDGSYGVPSGVVFSFPCVCQGFVVVVVFVFVIVIVVVVVVVLLFLVFVCCLP